MSFQSKFKGLRFLGEWMVRFSSKSEGPRTRELMVFVPVQGQEAHVPTQERERGFYISLSLFFFLFLVPFRSSMNCMRPTHTLGRIICFTLFTNSKANLFWKHTDTPRDNVKPDIWALYGPVRLTHNINHHKRNPYNPYHVGNRKHLLK